uniref:Uncharacterized protein n=1 Tax=Setaria italica TaxID=4555 RepID=K3YSD8_SETIT
MGRQGLSGGMAQGVQGRSSPSSQRWRGSAAPARDPTGGGGRALGGRGTGGGARQAVVADLQVELEGGGVSGGSSRASESRSGRSWRASAPPAEPSPLRSPPASPSPRRSTSAAPSEALSFLVARTFSSNGASSSYSKPLPSLFRGVRPSPKPGAALAGAAAASRAVLTPHAAAIKSRRSVSAPVEKLLEEGSGFEASEELPSTGSLETEVEEKGNSELVPGPTEQTASGSGTEEFEEEKHAEVEIEESSGSTKLVEASTLDSVVADDFSGHEQTAENGSMVETDQVENHTAVVYEENAYDQTGDDNYVQSAQSIDPIGSVSEESFDDDWEADRSDSIIEDQVESESSIDKVIEERMGQLEISRKAEKNAEKKQKVSMKPLELAEELEKRQASFGQHWKEGAAAQPMQLEGIGKGPPAIGYMQIEMDNPVTRAMSSPSFTCKLRCWQFIGAI